MLRKLLELIKTMFKIGCIGFGGGSALIPVLEKETVSKKGLVSKEDFEKNVVVASITPGALPVEIASGIGLSCASYSGMVLGAMAMALPGAIATILLLSLFSSMEASILQIVKYIAIPVSIYIICMLLLYVKKAVHIGDKNSSRMEKISYIVVVLLVFVLNSGKKIDALIGIDLLMFFDLSSIHILGMAFFVIFFLSKEVNIWKICLATIICMTYSICAGKNSIEYPVIEYALVIFMAILGGYGAISSFVREKATLNVDWKQVGKCLVVWLVVLIVMITPALFLCRDVLGYIGSGLLSSLMSFGGGDAYLSVADGLFVQSGLISEILFYGQLVIIVNVLPGSILCKTLSGVGYIIGYSLTGNIFTAIAMALAGFGVSVFGSCSISITSLHLYSGLQQLTVFRYISRWIKPIIGGTLLSICLSMVAQIILIWR